MKIPFTLVNKRQDLINLLNAKDKSQSELQTKNQNVVQNILQNNVVAEGSVGFVPTMGALHYGHKALIEKSVSENENTVVSIFVNPKQFGPKEDFSRYPRALAADADLCKAAGASIVFAPSVAEMYPNGFDTTVDVKNMTSVMCGPFRPGHFTGVTTVVLMLLNLVRANKAYFGTKDFQQLAVIRKMVFDLCCATEIVGVETIREPDGLAMSSRNAFLTPEFRELAKTIPDTLKIVAKTYMSGERKAGNLILKAVESLQAANLTPQYLELCDAQFLEPISEAILPGQPAVFALACPVGGVRLIDNIVLTETMLENFALGTLNDAKI